MCDYYDSGDFPSARGSSSSSGGGGGGWGHRIPKGGTPWGGAGCDPGGTDIISYGAFVTPPGPQPPPTVPACPALPFPGGGEGGLPCHSSNAPLPPPPDSGATTPPAVVAGPTGREDQLHYYYVVTLRGQCVRFNVLGPPHLLQEVEPRLATAIRYFLRQAKGARNLVAVSGTNWSFTRFGVWLDVMHCW